MANLTFCSSCGFPNSYSLTPPENCGKCGESFAVSSSKLAGVENKDKNKYITPIVKVSLDNGNILTRNQKTDQIYNSANQKSTVAASEREWENTRDDGARHQLAVAALEALNIEPLSEDELDDLRGKDNNYKGRGAGQDERKALLKAVRQEKRNQKNKGS